MVFIFKNDLTGIFVFCGSFKRNRWLKAQGFTRHGNESKSEGVTDGLPLTCCPIVPCR